MNLKELARYKGKIEHVDGRTIKCSHIAMHNQSSGNTFTHTDIRSFVDIDNMAILTAVGNDGKVFALEKSTNFNKFSALKNLTPIIEKSEKGEYSIDEYMNDVTKWLKGADQYGEKFVG